MMAGAVMMSALPPQNRHRQPDRQCPESVNNGHDARVKSISFDLTTQIMQAAKNVPDWTVYARRFRSIMNAYKRIGFKPKARYDFVESRPEIARLKRQIQRIPTPSRYQRDAYRTHGLPWAFERLSLFLSSGSGLPRVDRRRLRTSAVG
jgi:hypothetical protein